MPHGERQDNDLWQRRFGGDSSIIGTRLWIDGVLREVVGVMNRSATEDVRSTVWPVISEVLSGGEAPNALAADVVALLDQWVADDAPLDPADAPNAAARAEIEKVNLAFQMGRNVMLYLDDIQQTNPEFLQKFFALCDATRRIEGVYKGRTSTYDLRGKRFAVVMAGNPYTESGDRCTIPDMLSNRADT